MVPKGFSAAVYTQTTDVEGEVNGLMTYDRKVIKINEAEVRKAYPDFEKDNRSMNGAGKPAEGGAKAHLENGGRAGSGGRTRNR